MWSLENVGAVASTQQSARDRVQAHPSHPLASARSCFFSTEQQAGVGQHGRQWVHAGEALACSFAWPEPPAVEPQAVEPPSVKHPHSDPSARPWPLWVSLAAAEAAEDALELPRHAIGLKWPNDLLWREKKCGGVLVTRLRVRGVAWLIAGIGLNLRWTHRPEGFEASGLLEPGDRPWDADLRDRLLERLGCSLAPLTEHLPDRGSWQAGFAQRDWLLGQPVSIHQPSTREPLWEGVAEGVNALGQLQVSAGHGLLRAFSIGEASPRPGSRVGS